MASRRELREERVYGVTCECVEWREDLIVVCLGCGQYLAYIHNGNRLSSALIANYRDV